MIVGVVRELWRYPVKSMPGERLRTAEVTERGVAGDRRFALVDVATGKVVSAKQPRLWRELLTGQAARALRSAVVGSVATELSALLGREVLLTGTPPQDATIDRARPEEVLSAGPLAEVAHDVSRLRAAPSSTSPRSIWSAPPLWSGSAPPPPLPPQPGDRDTR